MVVRAQLLLMSEPKPNVCHPSMAADNLDLSVGNWLKLLNNGSLVWTPKERCGGKRHLAAVQSLGWS